MITMSDFKKQWFLTGPEIMRVVDRVGSSGYFILHEEVEAFEKKLAIAWRLPYAIGVGNGLDAIEIALRCSGIMPGDKVLTTPLSAFATTLAVMRCGGVPVFVDTDESGLLDLQLCREVLANDSAIRFMVPVHLYGHSMNLEELERLRDRSGLHIVEDCAQAIGASWAGRPVGTVGDAAAVSFYPTKNLGALGDGGAILTNNPAVAEKAKVIRHYGQCDTYVHEEYGVNSRLDELQAAILADVFLPRLPAWTVRRREIARTYKELIHTSGVRLPSVPRESESVWHQFPVVVSGGTRVSFRNYLLDRGIATGVHYPFLMPDQKALVKYASYVAVGDLSKARYIAERVVSLPIHPFLEIEEVRFVAEAVNMWGEEC